MSLFPKLNLVFLYLAMLGIVYCKVSDREEKNGGGGEDNPLRDGQRRWCSWILDNKEEVDS